MLSGYKGMSSEWLLDEIIKSANEVEYPSDSTLLFELRTELLRRMAYMHHAIEIVEWVETPPIGEVVFLMCPWCGNLQAEGHRFDCSRQIGLSGEAAKIMQWRAEYDAEERRRLA